jgi:hypothetical protein
MGPTHLDAPFARTIFGGKRALVASRKNGNPMLLTAIINTAAAGWFTSMNPVALYAPVNTPNGQNPEMQLSELRECAARRGWIVSGEYVGQGVIRLEGITSRIEPANG